MPQILFSPRLVANGASYVRFFVLGTDFGRFTISSFWCREFIFPLELPIRSRRKTKFKFFFTDLGALALSRALVGIGERALENECHRFDFHPDWSPTERAMFDSLFRGPILAVLHFPVFWWSRIYFSVGGLQLPLWATGQTGGCHIGIYRGTYRYVEGRWG